MIGLPEILYDPKYKGLWEFDEWKPKAKLEAPPELKAAIDEWLKEIEQAKADVGEDEVVDMQPII